MTEALAVYTENSAEMTLQDTMTLGKVLAQSGFFQDAREAAQAVAKILAGRELGIGPIAAMTGIYIVKGRVTMSATLIGAQIKRSGKYDYAVRHLDDTGCVIAFYASGKEIGESRFMATDAQAAGLTSNDNYKKFGRNMYFARAMSNGAKWYCPEVFSGAVYTPDELRDAETEATPQVERQTHVSSFGVVDVTNGELLSEEPEPPYDYHAHIDQLGTIRDRWKSLGGQFPGLKGSQVKTREQIDALITEAEAGIAAIEAVNGPGASYEPAEAVAS